MKEIAIVLAGGKGSRMNSSMPKQYMKIEGKPVLYYSLRAFEENSHIDAVVLVAGEGWIDYCKKEIVDYFGFHKVKSIIPGGKERYDSVYQGLLETERLSLAEGIQKDAAVFVHDGARPCISRKMIDDLRADLCKYGTAVAGVPVKDTIKRTDEKGYVLSTPQREGLWQIQTPQVFHYDMIRSAYDKMFSGTCQDVTNVTDDAMVVEQFLGERVHITEADYKNIKITTEEDMLIAELFLKNP